MKKRWGITTRYDSLNECLSCCPFHHTVYLIRPPIKMSPPRTFTIESLNSFRSSQLLRCNYRKRELYTTFTISRNPSPEEKVLGIRVGLVFFFCSLFGFTPLSDILRTDHRKF